MPFYWFFLCLKAWSITESKHNSNTLLCHIFTSTWKTSTDTKWNGNVPFKAGADPPSPARPINRPLLLEYLDYMGFRILFLFGFGIVVFKALATSLKCKCCCIWGAGGPHPSLWGSATHHNPLPPLPPSSHTWEYPSKKCVFLKIMSKNLILTLWCSDSFGDCFSALTSRTWWYINLHSLYHPSFFCILSMQSKQVHERANNFSCHSHYIIAQKTLGKSNFVELLPIMSHHFLLRRARKCILCFLNVLQGA